jgi:hypothetical protein
MLVFVDVSHGAISESRPSIPYSIYVDARWYVGKNFSDATLHDRIGRIVKQCRLCKHHQNAQSRFKRLIFGGHGFPFARWISPMSP